MAWAQYATKPGAEVGTYGGSSSSSSSSTDSSTNYLKYAAAGLKATSGLASLMGAQGAYRNTVAAVSEQIDANKLALQDRTSARLEKLSSDLSATQASQAAKGVSGAQGIYSGQEKSTEADIRADKINTLQTIRGLQSQKKQAKLDRNAAQLGGVLDIGKAIATAFI